VVASGAAEAAAPTPGDEPTALRGDRGAVDGTGDIGTVETGDGGTVVETDAPLGRTLG
jgi:hypothetical protein